MSLASLTELSERSKEYDRKNPFSWGNASEWRDEAMTMLDLLAGEKTLAKLWKLLVKLNNELWHGPNRDNQQQAFWKKVNAIDLINESVHYRIKARLGLASVLHYQMADPQKWRQSIAIVEETIELIKEHYQRGDIYYLKRMAAATRNLSLTYIRLQQWVKAREYSQLAQDFYREILDSEAKAGTKDKAYLRMGSTNWDQSIIFEREGLSEKALVAIVKATRYSIHDTKSRVYVNWDAGRLAYQQEQWYLAEQHFLVAEETEMKMGKTDSREHNMFRIWLAACCLRREDYVRGNDYLEQVSQSAREGEAALPWNYLKLLHRLKSDEGRGSSSEDEGDASSKLELMKKVISLSGRVNLNSWSKLFDPLITEGLTQAITKDSLQVGLTGSQVQELVPLVDQASKRVPALTIWLNGLLKASFEANGLSTEMSQRQEVMAMTLSSMKTNSDYLREKINQALARLSAGIDSAQTTSEQSRVDDFVFTSA